MKFERDPQQHVLVERVEVGLKRAGARTAVGELEDRRLDLDVAASSNVVAQRLEHRRLAADILAASGADDHVHVAQPHPRLLRERPVLVRAADAVPWRPAARHACTSSPRRLVTTSPWHREHGRRCRRIVLNAASRSPDLGQGQHRLQLGAVAGPKPGEAELAGVAQEDHPAGHRDVVAGAGVGAELLGVVRADDVAQLVGTRQP